MDELQQLLNALGASTSAEALTIINGFNAFASDARVATASADLKSANVSIQANATLARQIENATGKSGAEAMAAVLAWKQGSESAAATKKELEELQAATTKSQAAALLDAAIEEGRLAPSNRASLESLFADYGLKALETSLAAMPKATAITPGAPPPGQLPAGSAADNALTAEDLEIGKQLGLSREQIIENKKNAAQYAPAN